MADAHASVVDLSRLDREALEALVLTQEEKLLTRNSEIEHLKLIIAKLRRMMFGTKSEKIAREVEQLELKLEELETGEAARPPAAAPTSSSSPRRKRQRRPLPEHLPRETHTLCLLKKPAQRAVVSCRSWVRMSPKCWNISRPVSRSSATYVPDVLHQLRRDSTGPGAG